MNLKDPSQVIVTIKPDDKNGEILDSFCFRLSNSIVKQDRTVDETLKLLSTVESDAVTIVEQESNHNELLKDLDKPYYGIYLELEYEGEAPSTEIKAKIKAVEEIHCVEI